MGEELPQNAEDDRWGTCPPLDWPCSVQRPEPSPKARELTIAYALRQLVEGTELSRWFNARLQAYGELTRWDDAQHVYAVSRDMLTWQLQLSEPMMWSYLEGLHEHTPQ